MSTIGVGIPADPDHVGVIMEYSVIGQNHDEALNILREMIREAFDVRGWELGHIESMYSEAVVLKDGETKTTFACIAEW